MIYNQSRNKRGFSLIELLVVVTMIGLIGTLTTQIFILGIRSQAKSEVLKEVKQNGDFALSVMDKMIRNASDIVSNCTNGDAHITIQNPDGINTTFNCDNNKISSVSATVPADTSYELTSSKVKVDSCTFAVVCPTPPLSPKYVFVNFTVRKAGASEIPTPGEISSIDYQSTISLRTYK